MSFFPTELEALEKSLAQSAKWVRRRQGIETGWFGKGCGSGYLICWKTPDSIFGSFYTKDFWEADWKQCYIFVSSSPLLPTAPNGNCQGQNMHLDSLSVCFNINVSMFVGALKTLLWEAANPETKQVVR